MILTTEQAQATHDAVLAIRAAGGTAYDLGIRVHIGWGSTGAGHAETVAAVQAVLAAKLRGMIDGIIENAYREERQALADLSDVLGVRPA